MTVAIEVTEITLTMVTQQMDLAPVVLAETYYGLDRVSHRCRHFHGCGALIQIWLAGHLEMDILHPRGMLLKHTTITAMPKLSRASKRNIRSCRS